MGDRGNIVLRYEENGEGPKDIYLYTHWGGSELPTTLQTALNRKLRWDDSSYLGRIIFNGLTKGQEDGETGYGISPTVTDNEHDFLMVELDKQKVSRVHPDSGKTKASWTFEEFCELDLESAKGLKDF